MQTAHHSALISAVPTQDLLLLGIVFTAAALILLAISVEAGNYPKITAAMRTAAQTARGLMHRHASDGDYHEGRQATGH